MNSIEANARYAVHYPWKESLTVEPLAWLSRDNCLRNERQSKRVLLVDEDAAVREVLGRVLESEDYTVKLARTGREAAASFISQPPDLVLLDINLPDRDNCGAFRLADAIHPSLPVVAITARPNQYRQAACLGVDALMEKPLDLPVLLRTIRRLVVETQVERKRRLGEPGFRTVFLKTGGG